MYKRQVYSGLLVIGDSYGLGGGVDFLILIGEDDFGFFIALCGIVSLSDGISHAIGQILYGKGLAVLEIEGVGLTVNGYACGGFRRSSIC